MRQAQNSEEKVTPETRFYSERNDVDTFEENLYRMKPYIDSIVCTVSILNAFDMKEIEDYYMENFGITVRWYALYSPSSLSIKNLPNKDEIPYIPTDEIKGELMKECVPSELAKGYEYIKSLEAHRGFKYPSNMTGITK